VTCGLVSCLQRRIDVNAEPGQDGRQAYKDRQHVDAQGKRPPDERATGPDVDPGQAGRFAHQVWLEIKADQQRKQGQQRASDSSAGDPALDTRGEALSQEPVQESAQQWKENEKPFKVSKHSTSFSDVRFGGCWFLPVCYDDTQTDDDFCCGDHCEG
jgi:hypothetical protein